MNSRGFWIMTTLAFMLTWFVYIPYLASGRVIDLTAPVAKHEPQRTDHFTDSRGLTSATEAADITCKKFIYAFGMRLAAMKIQPPAGMPDRLYAQCMHDHKVMV